jgi:superfamily II DNA or RNA helicase
MFIQRIISNWTLYQSLILIHDTGTGKSGSAAVVFDGLKKTRPNLKTIYIVHNETSLNNFKNEIFKLSFILYDETITDSENYILKRNQIFKKNQVFFCTYYRFALDIKKGNIEPKYYEDHLFILDEVHHLISHDVEIPPEIKKLKKDKLFKKDDFKPYDHILDFLSKIDNKKLLLMTATPMRNSTSEIAPLLNLALPVNDRLLTGQKFIDHYFVKSKGIIPQIPIISWMQDKQHQFEEQIKGYISVVKQNPDVHVDYVGEVVSPMTSFRLYINKMSINQSKGYEMGLNQERSQSGKDEDSSFFTFAQQSSLFVFPDNQYGVAGAKIYMNDKKNFTDEFKMKTGLKTIRSKPIDKLNQEDLQAIKNNLDILQNYSATYFSIIQQIIKNRQKKIYIYSDKINGSGICVFLQLLKEFFGYELLTNTKTVQKNDLPRVIYLHNEQCNGKTANVNNLIRFFNDVQNKDGKLVQVIVGTDKTREGISLFQIEQIHICSGDWNFGKIYQAIGRGIRLNSHKGLPSGSRVRIFLHCAVPHDKMKNKNYFLDAVYGSSIDFYKYLRSETKDKNIKLVEYSLIRAAVDCEIHKEQNSRARFQDFSPDCYYKKCSYECIGIQNKNAKVDNSTYDLYYIEEFFKKSIQQISSLFHDKTNYTLAELDALLPDLTSKQIIDTLLIIIDTPVPIRFHDGRILFLNYTNDVFYLSENRIQIPSHDTSQLWIAMYDKYAAVDASVSFDDILLKMQDSSIVKICHRLHDLFKKNDPQTAKGVFDLFSPEVKRFVFTLIAEKKDGNDLFHWLREKVLNDVIFVKGGKYVLKYNREFLTYHDSEWIRSKSTSPLQRDETIDHNDPMFIKKYITDNPKKIYGFFEEGKFKIRDVSNYEDFKNEKSSTKGMYCMSFPFHCLIIFIYLLIGPTIPADLNQERIKVKQKLLSIHGVRALEIRLINHMGEEEYKTILKRLKKTINEKDLRFFIFFATSYHKEELCSLIEKTIMEQKLIVKPPTKKEIIIQPKKKRGRKPKKIIESTIA